MKLLCILITFFFLVSNAYGADPIVLNGNNLVIQAESDGEIDIQTREDEPIRITVNQGTAAKTITIDGTTGAMTLPAGTIMANDSYLQGANAAGSANINIIKVDTGDDTVINSSASDDIVLQLEDDPQRVIKFDAASDIALAMKVGDGGTTAAQNLAITGSTADADDDQQICISGGGACADLTRGSYLIVEGEQDAGAGDAVLAAIDDAMLLANDDVIIRSETGGDDVLITANGDDVTITAFDDVVIQTEGAADIVTIAGGGTTVDLTVADNLVTVASGTGLTLTSGDTVLTAGDLTVTAGGINIAAGQDLNFIDENGANTACNTTCTAGCVAGFDAGTNVFVDCADAIADTCLCAGAAV